MKKLFWVFELLSFPLKTSTKSLPKFEELDDQWLMTHPSDYVETKKSVFYAGNLVRQFGGTFTTSTSFIHFLKIICTFIQILWIYSKFLIQKISKPKCAYWSTKLKICKWIECLALVIASLLSAEDNDNDDMRRILFCVLKSRWIEALIVKVFWCRNGRDWR
jgi:hypothetical protein